jgi:hypothetical protein
VLKHQQVIQSFSFPELQKILSLNSIIFTYEKQNLKHKIFDAILQIYDNNTCIHLRISVVSIII